MAKAARWPNHPRWEFGSKPPWSVLAAKDWAKRTLSPDAATLYANPANASGPRTAADLDVVAKAKVNYMLERAKKVQLEREILAGKYTKNEEIEAAWILRLNTFKAALLALPRNSVGELRACSTDDDHIRLHTSRIIEILNQLADGTFTQEQPATDAAAQSAGSATDQEAEDG